MDPVGDFYVHVLNRNEEQAAAIAANGATRASTWGTSTATIGATELISSKWLITQVGGGKPAVIHFYDGG